MSGTLLGQILTFGATLITGRLFSPGKFGDLTFFVAWTGAFIVIASLRYEVAIMLPEDDTDAFGLLILSLTLCAAFSAIAGLGVVLGRVWLSCQFSSVRLEFVLMMSVVFVLASGWYQSLTYWSTRRKHFRGISVSQVSRAAVTAVIQVAAGISGANAEGLIFGLVIGQITALVLLVFQIWRADLAIAKSAQPSVMQLKTYAYQYRRFALFSAPQGLLNNVSQNIPVYLLSAFFGSSVVGHYGLAYRLLSLPSMLLGRSVWQVLMQRFSELYRARGNLAPLVVKSTVGLSALSIIPTLIVVLFGPQLFQFILGDQWGLAGQFGQWLALWLFFSFINTPAAVVVSVIDRLKMLLLWDILQLLLGIACITVGGLALNDLLAIATYSVVGVAFNLYLIVSTLLYIRQSKLYAHSR